MDYLLYSNSPKNDNYIMVSATFCSGPPISGKCIFPVVDLLASLTHLKWKLL